MRISVKQWTVLCTALLAGVASAATQWIWTGGAGDNKWGTAGNWQDQAGAPCGEGNYPSKFGGTDPYVPIVIDNTGKAPLTINVDNVLEGWAFNLTLKNATVDIPDGKLNKLQNEPGSVKLALTDNAHLKIGDPTLGHFRVGEGTSIGDGCSLEFPKGLSSVGNQGTYQFICDFNTTGVMKLGAAWSPSKEMTANFSMKFSPVAAGKVLKTRDLITWSANASCNLTVSAGNNVRAVDSAVALTKQDSLTLESDVAAYPVGTWNVVKQPSNENDFGAWKVVYVDYAPAEGEITLPDETKDALTELALADDGSSSIFATLTNDATLTADKTQAVKSVRVVSETAGKTLTVASENAGKLTATNLSVAAGTNAVLEKGAATFDTVALDGADSKLTVKDTASVKALAGGSLTIDATVEALAFNGETFPAQNTLRDYVGTVTCLGNGQNGVRLNGFSSVNDNGELQAHLVFEGGAHELTYARPTGGNDSFANAGSYEDPNIRVKNGTTLTFTIRDLSSWNNNTIADKGVLRVDAGGTLELKSNGTNTGYLRNVIWLDGTADRAQPTMLKINKNGHNNFLNLYGGAEKAQAQIRMPASDTPVYATVTGDEIFIGGNESSGAAMDIGANGVLTVASVLAHDKQLKKYGAGTLKLTAANTATGTLTIAEGALAMTSPWKGPLTLAEGVTLDVTDGQSLSAEGALTLPTVGQTLKVAVAADAVFPLTVMTGVAESVNPDGIRVEVLQNGGAVTDKAFVLKKIDSDLKLVEALTSVTVDLSAGGAASWSALTADQPIANDAELIITFGNTSETRTFTFDGMSVLKKLTVNGTNAGMVAVAEGVSLAATTTVIRADTTFAGAAALGDITLAASKTLDMGTLATATGITYEDATSKLIVRAEAQKNLVTASGNKTATVEIGGGMTLGADLSQGSGGESGCTHNLILDPGADQTVTVNRFVTGNGKNNTTSFTMKSGTLNVTTATANENTSADILLGHWPSSASHSLEGGTLNGENSVALFGWDCGNLTFNVGKEGGTAPACLKVKKLMSPSGKNGSSTLTVYPNGMVEIGEGGLNFADQANKHFILNGGLLKAKTHAQVTGLWSGLEVSADSTVAAANDATLSIGWINRDGGTLTVGTEKDAGIVKIQEIKAYKRDITVAYGTLDIAGANADYTHSITVNAGATLKSSTENKYCFGKGLIMVNGTLNCVCPSATDGATIASLTLGDGAILDVTEKAAENKLMQVDAAPTLSGMLTVKLPEGATLPFGILTVAQDAASLNGTAVKVVVGTAEPVQAQLLADGTTLQVAAMPELPKPNGDTTDITAYTEATVAKIIKASKGVTPQAINATTRNGSVKLTAEKLNNVMVVFEPLVTIEGTTVTVTYEFGISDAVTRDGNLVVTAKIGGGAAYNDGVTVAVVGDDGAVLGTPAVASQASDTVTIVIPLADAVNMKNISVKAQKE